MGRQRAENLHRARHQKDISEDRQGNRVEILHRDRYQKDISKRVGETEWISYVRISRKRERGREEKSKSRDLSNRFLKTDWETESGEPT